MASNFRVTGQRPSSRVTPTSQIQRTVEITFETVPYGIAGMVEVAESDYEPGAIRDLLTKKAADLISVHEL